MSAITELTDRVNTRFDEIGEGVDSVVASLGGIATDVTFLKETITKLQNSPGSITPEDQAALDTLESRVNGLASKVATAKQTATALDAATETSPTEVPPS